MLFLFNEMQISGSGKSRKPLQNIRKSEQTRSGSCSNNILLFYPSALDANDSFAPCFAFGLCIITSAVPKKKPTIHFY